MQNMTSFCADVILYWTLFSAGSTGILRLVLAVWLFAAERRTDYVIYSDHFNDNKDSAAPATVIALPGQGHPQSSGAV